MRTGKNLKPALEYAKAHGWAMERRTRRGSLVFHKPGCERVVVGPTLGDPRAIDNVLCDFRRQDASLAQNQMQQNP